MTGRPVVSLLALFTLMGTVFAGCLEAPGFLTASGDEVAARENLDLAENAAKAWNPEAVLVGVSSFEASEAHAMQAMGLIPADPTVGDGRALLWMYAYQTPGGAETRVFRVDADGRIQVENTSAVPESDIPEGLAVHGWGVDSDQAVEAARADAVFAEALRKDNVSVALGLANHEGALKWGVVAICEDGVVVAVVDATTGAVDMVRTVDASAFDVDFEVGKGGLDPAPPVHLEGSGTLDGREARVEFPFSYAGTGDDGVLELTTTGRLPGDGVSWMLLDAEGEKVDSGRTGRLTAPGESSRTFELELEETGDYTLVLAYTSAALVPAGGASYDFMLHVGGAPPARGAE